MANFLEVMGKWVALSNDGIFGGIFKFLQGLAKLAGHTADLAELVK
ncbi:MAG: hypothetical protein Q4D85_01565 [Corynebacterium sp.]|nr:hypothetical protein [Corynebacterium sp.]MDO5097416.1 hypothetical protein [Corynebacterium sp.]